MSIYIHENWKTELDCDQDEISAILEDGRYRLIEEFIDGSIDFEINWYEFRRSYSYSDIVDAYFDGVLTKKFFKENFPVIEGVNEDEE